MDITEVWNKFKDKITLFLIFKDVLNPGCNMEDLSKLEDQMELKFPNDLKTLYLANNGQKEKVEGIFKASSGYSKFSKLKFLDIDKILIVFHFLDTREVDVFTPELIPFAVDAEGDSMDDVYCIDSKTEEIYLLWVLTPDWTLPAEWQTAKLKRADNLIEFLASQLRMY